MPQDQMTEWKREYSELCNKLLKLEESEKSLKSKVKILQEDLRNESRALRKTTIERRRIQKSLRTFWQRKRAKLRRLQDWAKNNPGKAIEAIQGGV